LDTYERIRTKIESRNFSPSPVSDEIKKQVLEAARLTGSGMNTQHWRFILIQDRENIKRLAEDSTTGQWVESANFAIIVLTNPQYDFHLVDAGRAIQSMMLAAWNEGVASGIFRGIKLDDLTRDFALPSQLNVAAIVAFGYPAKKILGKKDRKPLTEIAYQEKYGQKLAL